MKTKTFWFYQFKSFLPITITYFFFWGLICLLATLYYLPRTFFWDTLRFSLPFLIIWFLVNSFHHAKQLRAIVKEKVICANNPVEAQLLRSYRLQHRESEHQIRHLNNQRQDQLDHIELYSHEIKNSLTGLQAAAENNDVVTSNNILQAVQQANYHLDMLLNDERLSMTSHDFNFEWISLDSLISEILKQNSTLFINHQLIPQLVELNGVQVLTDRKWFRFCINQLLSNAIKYSPNGASITLKWDTNELQIIDNGVGISSGDLPRIYDNGFSGKNGHQTTKSTGMGLYLVKKVTAQLNFSLTINSKSGQGTQAILHFPGNNIRKTKNYT